MHSPPYVFTKCGFVWGEDREMRLSLEAGSIRAEIEQSLRRLGVEAVDLYQIHWVEPEVDPDIEQAWTTLAELRREGKVRHIGVSNFDVAQIRRAQAIAPVETLQPPYSLLERSAETEILPFCSAHDIGVIVYSPMQSGLLAGSMTAQRVASLPSSDARLFDPNFVEPRLSQNLAVVDALRRIADRLGRPCGELAIGGRSPTPPSPARSSASAGPPRSTGSSPAPPFGSHPTSSRRSRLSSAERRPQR